MTLTTPLRALIELLEEKVKEAEYYSDESRFGLYGALDIAKSFLEKEKEVMQEFAWEYERDCRINLERSIEKCWEKTFNTKEK